MTTKQKAAARRKQKAEAQKRYRANLKAKKQHRGSIRAVAAQREIPGVKSVSAFDKQAPSDVSAVPSIKVSMAITPEALIETIDERIKRSQSDNGHAVDRFHGEGGALAQGQPEQPGAFTALMGRLDNLIERARNIRNRQGDSLMEATGQRESMPTTPGNTVSTGTASQPPRGIVIASQVNRLDEIVAELDAQSRIICNTLA